MPKRERGTSLPPRLTHSLSQDTTSDDTSTESHSGDDVSAGPRPVLPFYNKLDRVVEALASAQRIVVIAGAGISVSCGIPDFRSANGIYKMVQGLDNLGLETPEELFDLKAFRRDPRPFYRFAPALYPGAHAPSLTHRFLRMLELQGKLLRLYTQNIDGLEALAGIERHVACHGSFASATCQSCGRAFSAAEIREDVMSRQVPRCPSRDCDGVIKPDITFFGEKLGCDVSRALEADRTRADLLLVIGTSLKVAPVSRILQFMPARIPQILINRDMVKPPASISAGFDSYLLGDCDSVVEYLCRRLGCEPPPPLSDEELAGNLAAAVGINTAAGAEAAAGAATDARNKRAKKRAGASAEASPTELAGAQAAGVMVATLAARPAAAEAEAAVAEAPIASGGASASASAVHASASQAVEPEMAPAMSQRLPEETASSAETVTMLEAVTAATQPPVAAAAYLTVMEEFATMSANEVPKVLLSGNTAAAVAVAAGLEGSAAEPAAMDEVAVESSAAASGEAPLNAPLEPPLPAAAAVAPVATQVSSLKAELLRRLAAASAPAATAAAAAETEEVVSAGNPAAAAAEPAAMAVVPENPAAAAAAEVTSLRRMLRARYDAVAAASSPTAMATATAAADDIMEVDATVEGEAALTPAAAAASEAEEVATAVMQELIEAVVSACQKQEAAAPVPEAVAPAAAARLLSAAETQVEGSASQAAAVAPAHERGGAAASAAVAGETGGDVAVAMDAGSDAAAVIYGDGGCGSSAGYKTARFAVLAVITDLVARVAGDENDVTVAATTAGTAAALVVTSTETAVVDAATAFAAATAATAAAAAAAAAAEEGIAALPRLQRAEAKPKSKKGKGRSGKATPRSQGLASPRRSSPRWQDFKFKPPNIYHFAGFVRSPQTVARAKAAVKAHAEALVEAHFVETVTCDACAKELGPKEAVYSCRECFGYDLCVRCFSRGRNEHTLTSGHAFQRTDANFRVDIDDA